FVLSMEGVLSTLDRRLEDAARTLGANRWTVFRRITVPLVRPSVAAGAALCWARALGEFGATITFAGNFPGRTQTIPLAVYIQLENRPEAGVALSLVLLAVSLTILVIMRGRWLETPSASRRRGAPRAAPSSSTASRPAGPARPERVPGPT